MAKDDFYKALEGFNKIEDMPVPSMEAKESAKKVLDLCFKYNLDAWRISPTIEKEINIYCEDCTFHCEDNGEIYLTTKTLLN